ncbi:MAG: MauE/DoxX family redox-associated membrane protein [Nesterenkonia sp.]|nr:MauE/DoxX family redox-associated membrane protein [Nesterenkonia sp.]
MMTAVWLPTTATLAVVLIVSGALKAADSQGVDSTFAALRVPAWADRRPVRRCFPWLEMLLGILLLVSGGVVFAGAAGAVLLLTVAYLVLVIAAVRRPGPVDCGCFGASAVPVRRRTVLRNLVLLATAVVTAAPIVTKDLSPWWRTMAEHPEVSAAVVPVVVIGAVIWWDQAAAAGGSATTEEVTGDPQRIDDDEELLDYVREPIPRAVLGRGPGPDASRVSLRQLSAGGPVLLVRISSGCGGCRHVLADWDELQARVAPTVMMLPVLGPHDPGPDQIGALTPEHFLVDVHGELGAVFDAPGTPWAVLLGADGWLAGGPESGRADIGRMIEEIVEVLGDQVR